MSLLYFYTNFAKSYRKICLLSDEELKFYFCCASFLHANDIKVVKCSETQLPHLNKTFTYCGDSESMI